MKTQYFILALALTFLSCKGNDPAPVPSTPEDTTVVPPTPEPDPEGTIYFTETEEQMANPERGFYVQKYYTTANIDEVASVDAIRSSRETSHITLYLHSYYMADSITGSANYMASDIAPEFLGRLDKNMDIVREAGAKVILRFSYAYHHNNRKKPWDASAEWAMRHMDQLSPYLMKHADVIFCIQAGFIGSWGEWYYTDNYPYNPSTDAGYEPRWPVAEHLMEVTPQDRQICFRQPQFKMRYLRYRGMEVSPLTTDEAYQPTIKSRWAGHNDCFVSDVNDVGTYHNDEEREFWAKDSKYTLMGGETCKECQYSGGENAIKEMEKFHWSYLCNSYHPAILSSWVSSGHYETIKRRLGYRIALDKAYLTQEPKAGEKFNAQITLHNSGFAAPANKRNLELIFVSAANPEEKYIYPQTEDPRFWLGGETRIIDLSCTLDAAMKGEYKVYINLPDPYPSLHDNPLYSIRLANENMWEEATGYNLLSTITVE